MAVVTEHYDEIRVFTPAPPAGRMYGNVKEAGLPDQPLRRRVMVAESRPNAHGFPFPFTGPTFWTWADENGNWEVLNLDPALKYHVIAYDHTGQYDPVIKMNLVPTVD